jgi:3-methylcrotonyl-CoA carboxylase alpha subunit
MFTKILIANRGEIAVRIIATCREMGIRTVAVYSEADRNARHVREADEAYYIGTAAATQSYLRIAAIIEAAQKSGAQAIHPGYGFLSENAAFVEACEQAGIVFIGPPAKAMRLMGSKIAAKEVAISVNAPVIPGYNGAKQDDKTLKREAERIGYPLLIKASAGGGGKGMREVHVGATFADELAGARREALASFGDDTILLERLIAQPRHVEIQVLGDSFGNLIHLGERECSIQRRHQKIVEESPSVALTPMLRAEMGAAAVRIAKAAGYVNAGTMEFILDSDGHFYFLEMNTRLQVEHPVTEFVTGYDLVRHQLRIAAGERLDIAQEQVYPRGHAIEVRLYAEDPDQDFLPSTGTITEFIEPQGPGIRVDGGIERGDEITQYYDPMIAKLIVYGEDRPAAIERMQRALEHCAVFGVKTNAPLLHSIVVHPAFREGLTHTSFLLDYGLIGKERVQAHKQEPYFDEALMVAACLDILGSFHGHETANNHNAHASYSANTPWLAFGPWRMSGEARQVSYSYQGHEYRLSLTRASNTQETWSIQIDDRPAQQIQYAFGNDGQIVLRRGEAQMQAYAQHTENETAVFVQGHMYRLRRRRSLTVEATSRGGSAGGSQKALMAPMAGTIVKVNVHDGDAVAERQVLVILSAMKMEHTIAAPYEGKVRHIFYDEGAVVPGGATLVEME